MRMRNWRTVASICGRVGRWVGLLRLMCRRRVRVRRLLAVLRMRRWNWHRRRVGTVVAPAWIGWRRRIERRRVKGCRRWVFGHDNATGFGPGVVEAPSSTAVQIAGCVLLSNHDGAAGRESVMTTWVLQTRGDSRYQAGSGSFVYTTRAGQRGKDVLWVCSQGLGTVDCKMVVTATVEAAAFRFASITTRCWGDHGEVDMKVGGLWKAAGCSKKRECYCSNRRGAR